MMNDYTIRHWFRDEHDHRRGPCELREFLADKDKGWNTRQWRCWRQLWRAPNTCGCALCVDRVGRRSKRHAERVMWRNERSNLLKTRDFEDVDGAPMIRVTSGW